MDSFPKCKHISHLDPPGLIIIFDNLVRHIPAWFPGAGFKRKALKWRESVKEMVDEPFDVAIKHYVSI